MQVAQYHQFVRRTNQFIAKPPREALSIAIYGLVGEIGQLVAAVKKKVLGEGGEIGWDQPNDEIREELGDSFWYVFAAAQLANDGPFDVLASNIKNLRAEIGGTTERARTIAAALDPQTCSLPRRSRAISVIG